jgi:hypothetical protein
VRGDEVEGYRRGPMGAPDLVIVNDLVIVGSLESRPVG